VISSSPTYEVGVRDVEYLKHGDVSLLARIYQPRGAGPFPAVIDVHGGAWNTGDRMNDEPIDRFLAERGTLVAAIDFRQAPATRYPISVTDVNYGIRWLKDRAAEFNGRPDRVGGLGSSSGGHQVMLNALRPRDPRYASTPLAGDVDASLAYVVVCWGIVDPLARYHMAKRLGNEHLVRSHDNYWASEQEMAEGNPQLILERGEQTHLPPVLYIQGTKDDNTGPEMADRFAAAYTKAGGKVVLEKFDGAVHGFINRDPASPNAQRALELIHTFVRQQGGGAAC
jgi:acetyl esterase